MTEPLEARFAEPAIEHREQPAHDEGQHDEEADAESGRGPDVEVLQRDAV